MGKHKALILAAVILVLAAVSNGYARYYETWDGWFIAGSLTYNGYTYSKVGTGEGSMNDSTTSTRDTFYEVEHVTAPAPCFVCSALDDTIFLRPDTLLGGKEAGQSGTKEGDGDWSGTAVRRKNTVETTFTDVSGPWNTDGRDEYFDYGQSPPTFSGSWVLDASTPSGLTGSGTCNGERTYYSTTTPP